MLEAASRLHGVVKQGGVRVRDKGTLVLFALKARANTRRWLSHALSLPRENVNFGLFRAIGIMLTGKGLLWWELSEGARGTCSLSEYVFLTPTTKMRDSADGMGDTHSFGSSLFALQYLTHSPQCQRMSRKGDGRASAGGLRQQPTVEADGGEWNRAAAFVTAAPGRRRREAIIAARDLSVRNVLLHLSQRPRRASNTLIHHLLVFFSVTSIK